MSDGSFPAADNRNEACDIMPASRSAPREYPTGQGKQYPVRENATVILYPCYLSFP